MSCSTPIRLLALAVMLFALTFATIRVVTGQQSPSSGGMNSQVALGGITVPVEVIEDGEAPSLVEVFVQP